MNNPTGLEIAIIGINGKFPGANNLEEYWQNLRNGIESITNLTDEQIQKNGVEPALLKHPNYVKRQAIIDNIEYFDAEFFGFNPREAEILDPQHRLFLECAWTALEDAGYNPETYTGAIGVYAGAAMNNYLLNLVTNPQIQNQISRYQLFLSNDKDFLTTRVSYKLNLRGPSLDIQTACSTSLVAVHVACQSLLSGECDIALAGGVSLAKATGYLYQEGGIYSPDGHCRAFDADAQGTIAGSGLGIVVLKRLQEAIEDRDYIHAVIKGSAINNDGGLKVSYTAPRIDTQAAVIRAAQALAEVEPADISYIETHGTGTALGDPIEIAALTQAFRAGTDKTGFCAISSVKTNIGHLDASAGIASLIKTILALKHQQIPPNLHFQKPNPQIDFSQTPFYVNTNLVDWKTDKTPRRAGVSSFGIGGTNAHVILEEAPIQFKIQNSKFKINYHLLCLSAKSEKALEQATINLATHLQQHPQLNLADIAYTLQIGRQHFAYRRMVLCQTTQEAAQILEKETKYTHTNSEKSPSIAFMFSGQGSQYLNMGKELYDTEAIFREQIDHCCELLQHDLGLDLRLQIYQQNSEQLNHTSIAQPALFIIEYALAKLWISWGIQPQAMIGHSIGEYVAATLAGVFSLPDALKLVALRGRLMQQCPTGAMLSVGMSAAKLQPLLTNNLVIAAYNAPKLCVVSGTEAEIAQLETNLNQQGISNRRLQTSHAFHSPLMESMITPFIAAFQRITLQTPKIPFISNVTGTWITPEQATDPHYWVNHLRQPVQFATGIKELLTEPQQILLEVGAGRTLSTLAKQQTNSHTILSSLRHPQDTQSDVAFLLQTLGQLWLAGVSIDWSNFYTHQQRQRLPLPTYPFQRQRYWIDLKAEDTHSPIPYLQSPVPQFYLPSWERSLPHPQVDIAEKRLCCLVFTDNYGIYKEIINTLQAFGHDVIIVSQGEKYDQPAYRTFTVNTQNSQDFVELWSDLELRELIPHHILYLWYLTDSQQQTLSLLYLAQAISSQSIEREITLTLVTHDGQLVLGHENIQPMKATVWGMLKVISQEIPQLTCRCVDISLTSAVKTNEQITQQLIIECLNNHNDSVVAYRGNYRWNQIYKPLLIDDAQSKISVQEGGNYVILGDLTTGLGTVFAEFLMKMPARLVLISDVIPATLKQSLDNAGIDYLSLNIDITQQAELESAIAQAETKFGQINGVFYSTPMSNEHSMAFLPQLTTKHWEYNYRTKIQSLSVLAEVLRDKPLDFCVLQSSLSTVLGGLGLAAYAAANAVIDMFAVQQNQNSKFPWISINWDACRSDDTPPQPSPYKGEGDNLGGWGDLAKLALTPAEVWQSTQNIIKLGLPESIVVTKSDLDKRLEQRVTNTPSKTKTETDNSYTRPQLTNEYIAPRDEIETAIAQIWQDLLGISPIGINDSFFDLGGHSLLAIQAISRLRDRFGVELSMQNLLYEAPTIAAIAKIITTQNQNLEQMTALLTEIQTLTPEQILQQLNTPS